MTNIRSRNAQYHSRIRRAARQAEIRSPHKLIFIEYPPAKPKIPPPKNHHWVMDIFAVKNAKGRTDYQAAWRAASDPDDQGRLPRNAKNPRIVIWSDEDPEAEPDAEEKAEETEEERSAEGRKKDRR